MRFFLIALSLTFFIFLPAAQAAEDAAKGQGGADVNVAPAANDPFVKWYKPGTQLINVPEEFDENAKALIAELRHQFEKQISALPEEEWDANRKLAGSPSEDTLDRELKALLAGDSDFKVSEIPNLSSDSRSFDIAADFTAYNLSACGWHYYFISMQAKDQRQRTYTEANTKVLIAAATAISRVGISYESAGKKFDMGRNDKAIWQGMADTEALINKMAEAARSKKPDDGKKYEDIFNRGTKLCQEDRAKTAALILLKAYNK